MACKLTMSNGRQTSGLVIGRLLVERHIKKGLKLSNTTSRQVILLTMIGIKIFGPQLIQKVNWGTEIYLTFLPSF